MKLVKWKKKPFAPYWSARTKEPLSPPTIERMARAMEAVIHRVDVAMGGGRRETGTKTTRVLLPVIGRIGQKEWETPRGVVFDRVKHEKKVLREI